MERKFKHKKTGEIISYKDGVIKSGSFVFELGCEPSKEYWEEIKKELPIGTKIVDTFSYGNKYIYSKLENGKWNLGTQDYFDISEKNIGEGKRFQIIKEEVKKDFEILKFIKSKNIYNVLEDGNLLHDIPEYKNIKTNPSATHWTQAIEKGYNIHSVRRLSDNCIFQLGDKLNTGYIIESIYIDKEKQDFRFVASGKVILAKFAVKAKILFTTEDGVSIKEGDSYWFIWVKGKHLPNYQTLYHPYFVENAVKLDSDEYWSKDAKFFSTEKAAKDFIIYHKPCLSIKEILSAGQRIIVDEEKLKQLVKAKIDL